MTEAAPVAGREDICSICRSERLSKICFQDEARIGQKDGLVRQGAARNARQPADPARAYLFRAICPAARERHSRARRKGRAGSSDQLWRLCHKGAKSTRESQERFSSW